MSLSVTPHTSDTPLPFPTSTSSADFRTIWQLEDEAKEWVAKAEQQSQQEAQSLSQNQSQDKEQQPRLSTEPSPSLLLNAANTRLRVEQGNYEFTQKQIRAREDRGGVWRRDDQAGELMVVCDGHSSKEATNKGTADYTLMQMPRRFLKRIEQEEHPLQVFRELFSTLQRNVETAGYDDGTTVTACYHDHVTHTLYGATLGDSPATLYVRTHRGLEVHRLAYRESWSDTEAQARVPNGNDWKLNENRIQRGERGGLAVTRALGDVRFHPAVSSDPILWMRTLDSNEEYAILIASDGLSDWLNEHECGTLIRNWSNERTTLYPNYDILSGLLAAKALERAHHYWAPLSEEPDSYIDDITVITFTSKGF